MKKYSVCIVGGGSTFTLGFLKSFCRMKEQFPLKKLVVYEKSNSGNCSLNKIFSNSPIGFWRYA